MMGKRGEFGGLSQTRHPHLAQRRSNEKTAFATNHSRALHFEYESRSSATMRTRHLSGAAIVIALAILVSSCGSGDRMPATPTPIPPPPNPGLACGVERWFVKTLADTDAGSVNPAAVTPISIRDLNALPSHCDGGPDRRAYPEEFRVFEVSGRVIYLAHEDDRDYHIALEDPDAPGSTVVTELADTMCAGAVISPHLATLRSVEGMFDTLLGGKAPSTLDGSVVRVRGVGFYDFNHGQRGRSANCIELHPIVSISR